MKSLFAKIELIINEEFNNINQKIKGTAYLEKLKFNIINNLSELVKDIVLNDADGEIFESKLENDSKKIIAKMSVCTSPKIQLNIKLNDNLLLICLNQNIILDVEDFLTKKYHKYNLPKNSGITLSKGSVCNLNFLKNVLVLEIFYEDKIIDIENSINNTI